MLHPGIQHLVTSAAAAVLLATSAWADGPTGVPMGPGSNVSVSQDGTVILTISQSQGVQLQVVGGASTNIGGSAQGINHNGTAAAGTMANQAALWTQGAWTMLGGIAGGGPCGSSVSTGYDVAGDGTLAGSTVVGLAWDGCSARGFKWTQAGGMIELPQLGTNSSRASAISEDGLVIGGFDEHSTGPRRACIWDAGLNETLILVSVSNPDGYGEVFYLNDDGTVAVGAELSEPFKWQNGVVTAIPRPSVAVGQGNNFYANGCTDDGRVVVGGADAFFGTPYAWIWTEWGGTQTIDELLQDYGVTGYNPAILGACRGISADGLVIAGDSGVPFGSTRWYITLPHPLYETYCTAGTSASGCQASIAFEGVASATAPAGFELMTLDLEGQKDGQFFWGVNGRQANSWGNGTSFQCVVPPVKRGGVLAGSGTIGVCDGVAMQDLNARWTAKPAQNPGAGAVTQAQYWYRDPGSTSNQTTSLSNAIEFTVCPR